MLIKLHKPYHSEDYSAYVLSYSDYYPFGMPLPGRQMNSGEYRYGFNGKELDDGGSGMGGGGNTYDYGFRVYNPQIAMFLSVDPLTKSYPWYTPYQFAGNTPIQAIDMDGAEPIFINDIYYRLTLWYHVAIVQPAQNGIKDVVQSQTGTAAYNNPAVPLNVQKQLASAQFNNGIVQIYTSTSAAGHALFDLGGTLPVIGEPLDFINGLWYGAEGRYFEASFSFAATVPFLGWAAIGGKWTYKAAEFSAEIVDASNSTANLFEATFKQSDNVTLGVLAEKKVADGGKTLVLENITVYGKSADGKELVGGEIGAKAILEYQEAIASWAKEQGFDKITFKGKRVENSSSAKPGKELEKSINLKE